MAARIGQARLEPEQNNQLNVQISSWIENSRSVLLEDKRILSETKSNYANKLHSNEAELKHEDTESLTKVELPKQYNFLPGFFGLKNQSGDPMELSVGRQFRGYS